MLILIAGLLFVGWAIYNDMFVGDVVQTLHTDENMVAIDQGEHTTKVQKKSIIDTITDIFTTEEGEFIDFELQLRDFDEEELTKYVEFAENLYEKHQKHVSVYLLCPRDINVCVKECTIKSEADFTIKLAKVPEDSCKIILEGIKNKLKNKEKLDCDDLHALAYLPVMCDKEERNYYRMEYFKIINQLQY